MTTELEMDIAQEQNAKALDIGHILKAKRLSLSIDERQVATELKLSIEHVYALENAAFNRFRSATFARGYLKSYCRLLSLDHRPILAAFDEQQSVKESNLRPVDNVPPQASGRDPIFIIVSAIIIAIIVFVAFWWPTQSSEPSSPVVDQTPVVESEPALENEIDQTSTEPEVAIPAQEVEQELDVTEALEPDETSDVVTGLSAETIALLEDAGVDPEEVVEATREPEIQPEPIVEETPQPVVASHDIVIRFVADCWTEIRDSSGRILFSGVKSAGSSLELDGQAPYRVTLGYARGVSEFLYKGESFDFSSYVRKDLARFGLE